MTEQEQLISKITNTLVDSLNKSAKKGSKYVFKFIVNGEFYGYHASTFGQVTQDVLSAKRYNVGEYQQRQLEIISKSTISRLIRGRDNSFSDGLGGELGRISYDSYWKDVSPESLFIDFEYLKPDIEPHVYSVTRLK